MWRVLKAALTEDLDRLPKVGFYIPISGGEARAQGAAVSESLCPWEVDEVWLASVHRYLMGCGGSEIAAPWGFAFWQ